MTGISGVLSGGEVEKVSLPLIPEMERADVYVWKYAISEPQGVLVLCPGQNGDGGGFVNSRAWQVFAEKNELGLVGLSFASPDELLDHGQGYIYPTQGSGSLLLDGLHRIYGRDLPILILGFSGGACFTSRFVEWKSDRVLAWCAHAGATWEKPRPATSSPPGIVACGEEDENYGVALDYFKQGRALDRPWLWVTLPRTDHQLPASLEAFARQFFASVIHLKSSTPPSATGVWVDIDQGNIVNESGEPKSLTGWLPDARLYQSWRQLNGMGAHGKLKIPGIATRGSGLDSSPAGPAGATNRQSRPVWRAHQSPLKTG